MNNFGLGTLLSSQNLAHQTEISRDQNFVDLRLCLRHCEICFWSVDSQNSISYEIFS